MFGTLTTVSGSNTGYAVCMGGAHFIMLRITPKWICNKFFGWLVDPPCSIMICPLFLYDFYHYWHSRLWGRVPDSATTLEFGQEKKQHFLLHCKFSVSSSQQKCVGNNRNKTHRLSTLFCTKNHQNPFSSLRERVVWSCVGGFKKASKTKTHRSCLYWQ